MNLIAVATQPYIYHMSSNEKFHYHDTLKYGLKRGQQLNNNKTNEYWFLVCERFLKENKDNTNLLYGQFL